MKLCHVTISVKDLEESLRFYRDVIGLPVKRRFPGGPGSEIVFLGEGETELELIYNQSHTEISIGRDISIGIEVEDVQETLTHLEQKDIAASDISQPNPQVRFFFVSDPDGVKIQFVEYMK